VALQVVVVLKLGYKLLICHFNHMNHGGLINLIPIFSDIPPPPLRSRSTNKAINPVCLFPLDASAPLFAIYVATITCRIIVFMAHHMLLFFTVVQLNASFLGLF
jgi:hypothetical protein